MPYYSMDFTSWISLLVLSIIVWISKCQDVEELCRGSRSEKTSCGQCIKVHGSCSWCKDPAFDGEFRCDTEKNLLASHCSSQHIYAPKTKIEIPSDRPIGGHTQLQPQQVIISMRPGETITFPLKYAHSSAENRDALVLNSETESQGLALKYSSDCLGKSTEGRICSGLRPTDRVTFNVNVTLKQCVGAGDAVVSIGVGGVRDVVGLFVTPVCGCECEKLENHESRSQHCHGWGNLVCGSCVCIGDKGGKHCDSSDVEDCRATSDSKVCSGRGSCENGHCKCNEPDYYKGKFCECNLTSCPVYDSIMCAGHGQCECGKCICDAEYSGEICECHSGRTNCLSEDMKECSGNGVCKCNRCDCNDGYEGNLCEESSYEDENQTDEPIKNGDETDQRSSHGATHEVHSTTVSKGTESLIKKRSRSAIIFSLLIIFASLKSLEM